MHKTFVCILYIKCTVNSHEVCPLNSTWPASTFLLPTRPHFLRVHQHSKHIIPVFCHQGLDFEQHCPIFSVHLSLIELTFILALYQYFGLTDLVSFMIDFSFNLTLSKPLKTFPSSLFFFFSLPLCLHPIHYPSPSFKSICVWVCYFWSDLGRTQAVLK